MNAYSISVHTDQSAGSQINTQLAYEMEGGGNCWLKRDTTDNFKKFKLLTKNKIVC